MQGCSRLLALALAVLLVGAVPAAARTGPVELGAAINDWGFSSGPSVYRSTFLAGFDAATHEHSMKMIAVQPERGRFDFGLADDITDWALANGKRVHGHTLLWCRDEWSPSWVTERSWTRAELLEVMETHIRTVVSRYRGRIATWDVVNEGLDRDGTRQDCVWQRYIGDDWIEQAFRIAHESDPDALLFYNEYAAEIANAKFRATEAMAQDFLARGVPLHGIGLQHHTYGAAPPQDRLEETIARVGALGLQVHLSELDVPVVSFAGTTAERLEQQAQSYQTVLAACQAQPACFRVTTWGFVDGIGWRPAAEMALPFDTNYQPKPAWEAIQRIVAPVPPPAGNAGPPAPGAPSSGTAATRDAFTVSWGAVTDPDGDDLTYTLQHRDADSDWSTLATGVRGTSYALADPWRERQGTWRYRVRADDGYTEGPWSGSEPTVVDRTAPFAPDVAANRAPESDPWFRDAVTVTFGDNGDQPLPDGSPGAGVDPASVPAAITFSGTGTHIATGTVKDLLGATSVPRSRSFSVDATPPSAELSCPAEVAWGSDAAGEWTAADVESGVAEPSGTVPLATDSAGPQTASVVIADRVGHETRAECDYVVGAKPAPDPTTPPDETGGEETPPGGGEDTPPGGGEDTTSGGGEEAAPGGGGGEGSSAPPSGAAGGDSAAAPVESGAGGDPAPTLATSLGRAVEPVERGSLSLRSRTARVRGGFVRLRLACSAGECRARIVLVARKRAAGPRIVVLPSGGARWVSLGRLRGKAARLAVYADGERLGFVQTSRSSIQRVPSSRRSTG